MAHRGLLTPALEALDVYRRKIPAASAGSLLRVLSDFADDLPPTRGLISGEVFGPLDFAGRLVFACLTREPDMDKREEAMTDCLKNASGLELPIWLFTHNESDRP